MRQLLTELSEELRTLEERGLRRRLTVVEAVRGAMVQLQGRELVCWCSNDYLGLSQHPRLAQAAATAAAEWGIGARASRLLAGTTSLHVKLEEALAAWFGAEAALVYPSGYLTNLGTLTSLLSRGDAVFVDALAHASLLDAARASGATFRVFHHNDVSHLARLLERTRTTVHRFIVTEGVFSMDGDRAPLPELLQCAERHGAVVYLDDAHGGFVCGPTGRGSPEAAGVAQQHLLYIGTLGKALGCQGGFVAGPATLIEFLRNRSRSFIYSTALAVSVVAAALEALSVLREEPQRRTLLQARVRQLHQRLNALRDGDDPTHIIPIIVGSPQRALGLAAHLRERGCWAPAIRPPTVPNGTARIRLSVTALHTAAHVEALAAAVQEVLQDAAHSARTLT